MSGLRIDWDLGRTAIASPLKASLIYLVAGSLWAAASDLLLSSHDVSYSWLTVNRVVFVGVTAALFYLIGNRFSGIVLAHDVAERESTARAKAYLNCAVEGIVVIDRQGRIVDINPAAECLFGYAKEELTGQPLELLLPERFREAHVRHRAGFFGAPEQRTSAMRAVPSLAGRRRDTTEFPARVNLSYVPTKEGGLAIASVVDITDELAAERAARRTETLTALGAATAGIAHELNNPLAVISSRIELMLATGSELPPKTKEDMAVLLSTANRASSILHDMLAHVRQQPQVSEKVDLKQLVGRALLLTGGQMRRNGIRIETRLDENLPAVSGDATALEQVLINLLMNARDAMANGGTVQILAEEASARPGWVRLVVQDDGCGIPPEVKAKLFSRFFTTKSQGTGLGLWLSQRIIFQHRGNISVQSEPGKGTAFEITLPAIPERPEARGPLTRA